MDEDPWFRISRFVTSRREALGLSRDALAKKVDVTRATIYNWETGRRIPIERLAHLAVGLEVDHDELLRLHPEVPTSVDGVNQVPRNRTHVVRAWVGGLVLAAMAFTWYTASSDCLAIAAGVPSLTAAFEEAFEHHGGSDVMGCPDTIAEKWGPGHIQQFLGGSTGNSALMRLEGSTETYVLAGPLYWDYVAISAGATPDIAGFPVSNPLLCGDTLVVLLAKGLNGPGALVSTADGEHNAWIPSGLWAAYSAHGGPTGPLGAPTELVQRSDTGERQSFEGGTITLIYGGAPVVDPALESSDPFSMAACTEAVLAEVAQSEMRVDKDERRVRTP